MHMTSFNGGLFWGCPIAGFSFDANFMITIVAKHETEYNSFEDSISSSWKIKGLESYLVCNEKNQLDWLSLTGDTACFDRAVIAGKKSAVDKGRMLVAVSEDEYVVIDEHSRKWFYKRGSLEKVQFGEDDELVFKCSNGLIREIAHEGKVTLSLRQQDSSLLFFVGGRKIASIEYDKNGQLIQSIVFEEQRRPPVRFGYQDNNLATITVGDSVRYEFVWKKVGFLKQCFSTLLYPYYLYSDGRYTYDHEFYFGRATMTATDTAGHREKKTLNLKTGLITDRDPPVQ
jgi:hypothetical protein